MGKNYIIKDGDISDGYHTFDELYEHRIALFIALAKWCEWESWYLYDDGDEWFCMFLETPAGQVSYHLPVRLLEKVKTFALNGGHHSVSNKWDGHPPARALERLQAL